MLNIAAMAFGAARLYLAQSYRLKRDKEADFDKELEDFGNANLCRAEIRDRAWERYSAARAGEQPLRGAWLTKVGCKWRPPTRKKPQGISPGGSV